MAITTQNIINELLERVKENPALSFGDIRLNLVYTTYKVQALAIKDNNVILLLNGENLDDCY